MLRNRWQAGEDQLGLPRDDVGQGWRRALVGYMQHLDLAGGVEHLAEQMVDRAVTCRAEGNGIFGRISCKLFHVTYGQRSVGRGDEGHVGERGDGAEIGLRVERQFFVDADVDRMRTDIRHQQRVAIGRRLGHHVHADIAARAGAVFNHHRLPPFLRQLLTNDPRQRIRCTARRLRNDNAHRFGWEGLGVGIGLKCGRTECHQCGAGD